MTKFDSYFCPAGLPALIWVTSHSPSRNLRGPQTLLAAVEL